MLPQGIYTSNLNAPNSQERQIIEPKNTSSLGSWLLNMFLYSIPIVNIIYTLITIFTTKDVDKKYWAIAGIIMIVVQIVIFFILFSIVRSMSLATLFKIYSSLTH